MFSRCKNYNLFTAFLLAVSCGLIVFGAPSAALAARPDKRGCTDPQVYPTVYDRLECRQAALAEQVGYTSDVVFAEGTKLHQRIKPARLTRIKNAKQKALRAKDKNTKEAFKRQAKSEAQGNKKGGHLVPLDDELDDVNSDGICDYEQKDIPNSANAKCAAIELTEDGELQECNPEKKNKGKGKDGGNPKFEGLECDLFFDSTEGTDEEEEDMEQAAEQLDATYSATEDDLIEMNEHLDIVNANLPEGPATALTTENGCVLPELTPGLAVAVSVLRGVHAALFGAARIAADYGGQDFVAFGFGGNTRTVAIAFDSIALAANIAYITIDEIHKSESGELQSAIMDCVNQTAGAIAALKSQIQQEHAEIMANDNANTATLVDLLNTPQGLRPQFPIQ